jgi:hypothetical protein
MKNQMHDIYLNRSGDGYILKGFGRHAKSMYFCLNSEFIYSGYYYGYKNNIIHFEGNKMIQVQKKGDRKVIIEREYSPEEMIMTITADDFVTAKRYYKRDNSAVARFAVWGDQNPVKLILGVVVLSLIIWAIHYAFTGRHPWEKK